MFDTDVSIVVRVDVMVDIWIDVLTCTVISVLTDIGVLADVNANMWAAMMAVLELIILPSSLEELLLFCWTAFR